VAAIAACSVWPALAGDWSPRLAADYLDARQKEWFAWPAAKAVGGPCLSCHTGVTYLLARPALRRSLGENEPTPYETGLADALRARLDGAPPDTLKVRKEPFASQEIGVEAVLSALFLNIGKPATPQSSSFAQRALDRLWPLQIRDGKAKGAWAWFELNADPYEMPDSRFFGASLGAMAVGSTPPEYRAREDIKPRIAELAAYFERERQNQPLHNRLMLLWASAQLPEALAGPARQSIIEEALRKQQPDGSWKTVDLGPWAAHPDAPPSAEVDCYATALAAFALEQAGVPPSNAQMTRALAWLRSHQDPKGGYWPAMSMNKRYEAGSMQVRFMQDAATAFAALALIGAEQPAGGR
jgi:squalene-hopene/tetraprenyl-beta-curcumene cyclase